MKLGNKVRLGASHVVLDGDPAPLLKMDTAPNFRPMYGVTKRLDGLRCHLMGTDVDLGPGDIVLDGDTAPPIADTAASNFDPCIVAKRLHESRCHLV